VWCVPHSEEQLKCTATGGPCKVLLLLVTALTKCKALQLLKLCCCSVHGGHTLGLKEGGDILLTRLQEQQRKRILCVN
jgi:hypothetical protein